MSDSSCLVGALVLAAASRAVAAAADAGPPPLPPPPTARALVIERGAGPVIDGDIGDAVWQQAERLTDFHQAEPNPLTAPSERTEAWIVHDGDQLYVAIHAHDSQPGRLVVSTMERDGNLDNDDTVRLLLDPRRTRREAYLFEVNSAGARRDALVFGGAQPSYIGRWDALWRGKSRRVADGWTAEFAIPFRALSYDAGSDAWNLDIERTIGRKQERIRWSATPAGTYQIDVTYAGSLSGMTGMTQGRGLDVVAYLPVRVTRNWLAERTVTTGHPSATAYYKITPALTSLLTVNTDFSDKPLDSRQVNTTRFSLFEPETRDFFLQDADAFEFGNFGGGPSANGRPFFSRNIGLVNGREVNMDVGAKLSGDVGRLRIGALSVRTGASDHAPAQTLSVARLTTGVLSESRLGAIFTSGDPTGLSRNQVAGVDFQYRNSSFPGRHRLVASGYVEHSNSSTQGDDIAWGGDITWPNEPLSANLRFKRIGADFAPALGFINRPGIESIYKELDYVWRPRDSWLRRVTLQPVDYAVTDLDGRVQSQDTWLALQLLTTHDDYLQLALDRYREAPGAPFDLPGNIIVPAGNYIYYRPSVDLKTAQSRRFALHWYVAWGPYLDGRSTESTIDLALNTGPRFHLDFHHALQTIRLPGGATTIHIESLTATRNFTPEQKLVAELQYDNVSHQFGASLRYRWEPRPTTELLVTLGESAVLAGALPHGSYRSQATAVAVRFGHRFQY